MLAQAENHQLQQADQVEQLEAHMLALPQAECPVVHHFGPGIYVREVTLPAGTLAIGHAQRFEHLNIMLTGSVAMLDDNGQTKILKAPMIFVGKPGRKVGFVLETCVWQNVYATDERDIDKLEAIFLDKSETWQAYHATQQAIEHQSRQADRDDFAGLIADSGFSAETVRNQSENEADQIGMPPGYAAITIRASSIEGLGVFLSYPVEAGELIGPARIDGMRTPLGRYTNHSSNPNAQFVRSDNGHIYLVALRRISGCEGGSMGEEVTVDYRQALALSGIFLKQGDQA
jgi:hypothetical protein